MPQFLIRGSKPLRGTVNISGSKNAALPILAATLLTDQPCILHNVPDIEDVHVLITLLRSLGSDVTFRGHTVTIQTKKVRANGLSSDLVCTMRASVLLLGPLLARTGKASLPFPGGCVLGARPIDTHASVLEQLGVQEISDGKENITFRGKPKSAEVVLPEFSVTATENALMAAALSHGETTIRLAALEPHVQDLCRFLQKMGVKISGIGSHTIKVSGRAKLQGATHRVTPDYLEAGTFILAAILTRGNVTVKNLVPHDLDAFWSLLRQMEIPFELGKDSIHLMPVKQWKSCQRLQTNVFPGFPTDLQPPFVILLTQAHGQSLVHETLFEGRFSYFPDLLKMGAKIEKSNPHEATVMGPTPLRGTNVKSWDIRAGAAMILAALAAKGESVVSDVHYIDRGYEHFDEKLRSLGADITRLP